ncbi:AMP-binding enzyme family protein [Mycobacterium xenopi 3993]|nr:AMP-binding enzyme family protein [Mycobacterium xenopi 3993]
MSVRLISGRPVQRSGGTRSSRPAVSGPGDDVHRRNAGDLRADATAVSRGRERPGGAGRWPGDGVALYTATCPEWVYFWLGAARIGAVTAAVNAAHKGDFLLHALRLSRAKVVITDPERRPRLDDVAAQLDTVNHVMVQGNSLDSLLSRGTARPVIDNPADVGEVGSLFFTSGTTGPSKAVATTWHYLFTVAASVAAAWEFAPGEVLWTAMPCFTSARRRRCWRPCWSARRPCWQRLFIPARCGTRYVLAAQSDSPVPAQWCRCCGISQPIPVMRSCRCASSQRRPSTPQSTAISKSATAAESSPCTA